jgi:hypothetical protein
MSSFILIYRNTVLKECHFPYSSVNNKPKLAEVGLEYDGAALCFEIMSFFVIHMVFKTGID